MYDSEKEWMTVCRNGVAMATSEFNSPTKYLYSDAKLERIWFSSTRPQGSMPLLKDGATPALASRTLPHSDVDSCTMISRCAERSVVHSNSRCITRKPAARNFARRRRSRIARRTSITLAGTSSRLSTRRHTMP